MQAKTHYNPLISTFHIADLSIQQLNCKYISKYLKI